MRIRERGYTLIELLIAISIMALASIAAGMAIYQVLGGTEGNNDRMTALHQVQNAGFWINRDAQMAVSVNTTDNLSYPYFLQLGWTEWDENGDPLYHTANYTLVNPSGDIYSLMRTHSCTDGSSDEVMIADFIYYQPGAEYTSNSSYSNPMILVNLTSVYEDMRETREYSIKRRAGL